MTESQDNNKAAWRAPVWRALAGDADVPDLKILFEGDSQYHHVTVSDFGPARVLCLGENSREVETSISLSDPDEAHFEYPGMMFLGLALSRRNKNILLVGLGGGYMPKLAQKHLPELRMTVVEIDPLVAELAKGYFGFRPAGGVSLVIEDGQRFLENSEDGAWDQIWLDAANGNYVPANLATKSFLETCRRKLTPGGLLVHNLHRTAKQIYDEQMGYLSQVFYPRPLLFLGRMSGNNVAICLNSETETAEWPKNIKEVRAMVKEFRSFLGPYDLLRTADKLARYIV